MALLMACNDIVFGCSFFERNCHLDVDVLIKKKVLLCSLELPARLHMFTKRTCKFNAKYGQSDYLFSSRPNTQVAEFFTLQA